MSALLTYRYWKAGYTLYAPNDITAIHDEKSLRSVQSYEIHSPDKSKKGVTLLEKQKVSAALK